MQPDQPQAQSPQVVQPQPTPETWTTDIVNHLVVVVIYSVNGQHVSFVPPDNAIALGENLVRAGHQAKSGLVIPPAGLTLPQPPPNGHKEP